MASQQYENAKVMSSKKLDVQNLYVVESVSCSVMSDSLCPITSWQADGETVETVADFIFLGSKITADGDCSQKLKDSCSLEEKL